MVVGVEHGKGAKALTSGAFESRLKGLQGQLCAKEEPPPHPTSKMLPLSTDA